MLKVDDYLKIRLAHRDGMSVREISRRFGWSRQSVRKALTHAEPTGYRRSKERASVLDRYKPLIDAIVADDQKQPVKQRHTAQRIFERLVAEHAYPHSYDQVRRYVGRGRRAPPETFLPLAFEAGQRAECDFGHLYVDFPDGRRQVPVLIVTWAYSGHSFPTALPSERTEAILHGMVEAFAFFGCVPREVWWDNPKTVATAILQGRRRTLHDRYRALASHYRFDPCFCRPATGNEKPHVENRVKRMQRTWGTPVPCCRDLAELNGHLRTRSQAELGRLSGLRTEAIGALFERERAAALPLPGQGFDPCLLRAAVVDKYQTIRFETNWYSVPRPAAFASVTVKVYVAQIEVLHRSQVVARHERSYGRGQQILDPLHYLITLSRKPALLDHSTLYQQWRLPESFARLRDVLAARQGSHAGARHYIRVLQLLAEHPCERVAAAIDRCLARGLAEARIIAEHAQRLACRKPDAPTDSGVVPDVLRMVAPPLVNLSQFDQLLLQGDRAHA